MTDQSTAMVPAQSAAVGAANNANTSMMAIRGQVEGYRLALEFCDLYTMTAGIPKKFGTKGDMAAVLLRGAELGLPFGMALELMYTVNNAPAIMAQAVQGLVLRSEKGWIEIIESTDQKATVVGHRNGQPDMTLTWTKEQATKAGSRDIGGWTDKLVWKAIARIGRRMFPDVLGGLDVGDGGGEIIDYAVVPEQEGEYRVEARAEQPAIEAPKAAPAPAQPAQGAPTTGQLLKAELVARTMGANVVLDFLTRTFGQPLERAAIFDAADRYASEYECTIAELVLDAQAWDVGGRPGLLAAEVFDEGDWTDPSQNAVQSPTAPEPAPEAAVVA